MRRRARLALAFTILIGSAAGLAQVRGTAPSASAPTPTRPTLLVVAPRALDFGEVWENGAFGWVLPVTNPGPDSVRVEDIRTSCGCVVGQPRMFDLRPGETRDVRLTINLTPKPTEPAGV